MNINSEKGQLLSLHSAYNSCLKTRLDAWLKDGSSKESTSWCQKEREEYMEHMRRNCPTEFNNIKRLEESIY